MGRTPDRPAQSERSCDGRERCRGEGPRRDRHVQGGEPVQLRRRQEAGGGSALEAPQTLPVRGGRHGGHPHLGVERAGLPRGLRRAGVLRQGDRQVHQVRGRPGRPVQPRRTVPQVPGLQAGGVPSRPHPAPHEARGRARKRPVGAHHVGRGAGNLLQGVPPHLHDLRRRLHPLPARHRPRQPVAGRPHGEHVRQPQRVRLPVRHRLLPAPPVAHDHDLRRHAHRRLLAVLGAALRRPRVGVPRVHHRLGLQPHHLQPRLLHGPLGDRRHEARLQAHQRGAARHVARRARRHPPAAAPRASRSA